MSNFLGSDSRSERFCSSFITSYLLSDIDPCRHNIGIYKERVQHFNRANPRIEHAVALWNTNHCAFCERSPGCELRKYHLSGIGNGVSNVDFNCIAIYQIIISSVLHFTKP